MTVLASMISPSFDLNVAIPLPPWHEASPETQSISNRFGFEVHPTINIPSLGFPVAKNQCHHFEAVYLSWQVFCEECCSSNLDWSKPDSNWTFANGQLSTTFSIAFGVLMDLQLDCCFNSRSSKLFAFLLYTGEMRTSFQAWPQVPTFNHFLDKSVPGPVIERQFFGIKILNFHE